MLIICYSEQYFYDTVMKTPANGGRRENWDM